MDVKPRILYISSASPVKGPGAIGWKHVTKLKQAGYNVDMLTLYREPSLPDVKYIKDKVGLAEKIRKYFLFRFNLLKGSPHYFFYREESLPPVAVSSVVSKITKEYDLVMVYFWQEMLSFNTIEVIYEKLNHPVFFFFCPDYSHMSGGCHFTCNCTRFEIGCGKCPAFGSNDENDFTHRNVLYRKRVYEKVKPVVFGNSYMNSFYEKSYLLKDVRKYIYQPIFEVDKFLPIDPLVAKSDMGIVDSDAFVIAFGCQNLLDPRKGISYLIESLKILKKRLKGEEASLILLLVIGSNYDAIRDVLPFKSIGVGLLPTERLSTFYSSASIFVCPSVDDAGPSMVSQSIACGTPVVGFKMGAMLDNVFNKGTGYCAELRDSNDLADGMEKFFRMAKNEYAAVTSHCRQYAVDNSGFEKRIRIWMELYERYREK